MTLRDVHPELFILIGTLRGNAIENGSNPDDMTPREFAEDLVMCVDVLENMPVDLLERVITEMRQEKLQ